jgi:hypothetical protein
MKRLRQLEEENGKLKKIVADLSLGKEMLQDVIRRKALKPVRKRQLVDARRYRHPLASSISMGLANMARADTARPSAPCPSPGPHAEPRLDLAPAFHFGRKINVL